MDTEEKLHGDILDTMASASLPQGSAVRGESPSRRGKVQLSSSAVKSDDLEELEDVDDNEDDEEEDNMEVMDQDIQSPIDEPDDSSTPLPAQFPQWSGDWGEVAQDRKGSRKRPALDDLPDDVREELAIMSGTEVETRIRQRPKLEPPDSGKDVRGRKSPIDEDGVDLSQILSRPAKTPEERLAVLEARDKLIRNRSSQQRNTQLKNVGKCPDMCPEKERYQRIARHQVDYYEYNRESKEVNHAFMVKIYARSSADQQMPLPHDLRPANVLWMTMSYLINQFIDLADNPSENLGEWYHFLWDRMRSIRKDVTQLALCDLLSVQILEMCARFHIFCMERLREEKMAVFDEKINRENLTKCLQSLQYMYNDLSLKNVSCPNEPEFQAYSILLHINSDLCTSTIVGLRPEVRKHPKVQLAINAFVAVTMKNYVRFFKLVKSTSYLNACILHQYFAQVRAHAMHSIIRAYSRQKMRNTYPLSELQIQLLFDSRTDVLEFCRFSNVPVEENNIVLEKNVSHPIPMQEKMKRSFAGVEEKRQSSIKDIVTGGYQLADTSVTHKVHNSFDDQGILKPEAWYAEDQDSSVVPEASPDSLQIPSKLTSVKSSNTSGFPFISSSSSISVLQKPVSTTNLPFTSESHLTEKQSQKVGMTVPSSGTGEGQLMSKPRKVSIADFSFASRKLDTANVKVTNVSQSSESYISITSGNNVLSFESKTTETISKPFVFRLVESKTDSQESKQTFSVSSILQTTSSSHSIFGTSVSSSIPRIPGSSVMRQPGASSSGNIPISSALEFWNSQKQSSVVTSSESNFPKVSDVKMPLPVSSSSFFTGTFSVGSGNFWGAKPVSTISQASHFSNVATSAINFTPVSSTTFNQFPSSVYGPQTSIFNDQGKATISPTSVILQSSYSKFTKQIDDASHKGFISSARDVTVPTSIFGSHSRPLTTPQMFPTSGSNTSTILPSQIVSSMSPSLSQIPVPKAVSPEAMTKDSKFLFTVTGSVESESTLTSSGFTPVSYARTVADKISSTSRNIHFTEPAISPEQTESEEDSDISGSETSEEKEDEEMDDNFTFQIEPQKFKSPFLRSTSKSLLSPVSKTVPPSPKLFDKTNDPGRKSRILALVSDVAHKWRLLTYRSKVKLRVQTQKVDTPMGTKLSLEEQVDSMPIPQGCVAVDIRSRLDCLLNLEDLMRERTLLPDVGLVKLENIIRSILPSALLDKERIETNMFWKLLISLPGELEGKKYSLLLENWINETFADDSGIKAKGILRISRLQMGGEYNLFTSVQREIGILNNTIPGVNGVFFFTPQSIRTVDEVFKRFQSIVNVHCANIGFPLIIIIGSSLWKNICQKWCETEQENQNIRAFKIIGPLHYDKAFVADELKHGVMWLSKNVKFTASYEKRTLKEILTTLMIDLWNRVRYSIASRCSSGTQQHPEDLINLYHDALNQLSNSVVNFQLSEYGDIPSELEDLAEQILGDKYESRMLLKSPHYIKRIKEGLTAVRLNVKIPSDELPTADSFCEAVCRCYNALRPPISHYMCQREDKEFVDWTELVEAITSLQIRNVISELKLQNLVVVFEKSVLTEFCCKPWYSKWLKDRFVVQISSGEVVVTDVNDGIPIPTDPCEVRKEPDSKKMANQEEQFIEDFELLLNNVEVEFNIMELNSKQISKIGQFSPSNSELYATNNKKCDLDTFELQLDKYAKFLMKK